MQVSLQDQFIRSLTMAKPTEQSKILAIIIKKYPKCTAGQAAKIYAAFKDLGEK